MIIYEAWMFDDNGANLAKSLLDFIDLVQNETIDHGKSSTEFDLKIGG